MLWPGHATGLQQAAMHGRSGKSTLGVCQGWSACGALCVCGLLSFGQPAGRSHDISLGKVRASQCSATFVHGIAAYVAASCMQGLVAGSFTAVV